MQVNAYDSPMIVSRIVSKCLAFKIVFAIRKTSETCVRHNALDWLLFFDILQSVVHKIILNYIIFNNIIKNWPLYVLEYNMYYKTNIDSVG